MKHMLISVVILVVGASLSVQAKTKSEQLVEAAQAGDLAAVKDLLAQGLVVKGDLADKAVMTAAEFGHLDIVEELMSRKILPQRNLRDELFLIAVFKGNQAVATALIEGGVRLESNVKNRFFSSGRLGGVALLTAANNQQDAMVHFLLDYKVNPNTANDSGRYVGDVYRDWQGMTKPIYSKPGEEYVDDTPLIAAARVSSSEVIKILLENGANVNAHNKAGVTALMVATQEGNYTKLDTVKLLIEMGANVAERDRRGRSALDYARDKLEQRKKGCVKDEAAAREKVIEWLTQAAEGKGKKPQPVAPAGTEGAKLKLPVKVQCEQEIEAFADETLTQPSGLFKPPAQLELVELLEKSGSYRVIFRQEDGKEMTVYCRKKDIEERCGR
jgi:ankyrin repeat protein